MLFRSCLIADRVEHLTRSKTRKKLTKSDKFLFFDLGVRRLATHEGTRLPRETMGLLFEQFIGLELIRLMHVKGRGARVRFWRDPDGPEVDWMLDEDGAYTPIEVKLTENPAPADIRHLEVFLS